MKYFDLLEIYRIIENYRFKKANIFRFFLYNKSQYLIKITKKNLAKEYFFIKALIACALISSFFGSLDFQRYIFFDNQLFSASFYFDEASYLPYLLDNILSNLIKKFSLNILLVAKIFWLLCGLLTFYFSGFLLKKNNFKISLIQQNLLLISFGICYFFSFNYDISALENSKNFFILLFAVYLPLLLIKNNFNYLILTYVIGLSLVLLKSELIILIACYETLHLQLYFQGKNNNKIKLILSKILIILLRLSLLITVYFLLLQWVFKVNFFESIIKSFDFWQFYNFKFFSSQFLQTIYIDQNNQGYFLLLSRDLLLVLLSLFAYHKIIADDLKGQISSHKISIFWGLFLTNIFLSLFYNNFLIKEIVAIINFIILFQVFGDLLLANKINYKKYGIVLLIFICLALGDHKIFFELFFYLPMLWFLVLIILGSKIRNKIAKKNFFLKLNFFENFFILKNSQNLVYFGFFVLLFLVIEFKISYFLSWFIAVVFLILMINSYHNIYKKIIDNKYCSFLSILIIVVSFVYFLIPKFSIFGYKNALNQNLISEKKLLQQSIAGSLLPMIKDNDKILIIAENLKNLGNLKIFFLNNKINFISNDYAFKNYFAIVFDNSLRINYRSCDISDFEKFLRLNHFNLTKNQYRFYKKINIAKELPNDFYFKKTNTHPEDVKPNNNIIFYEYLIFIKD